MLLIPFVGGASDSKASKILDNNFSVDSVLVLSRSEYKERLYGFWLGQCIANWTGLVTEMDKIGNIGEIKTGKFYTRNNWGGKDEPSIWSSETSNDQINFVLKEPEEKAIDELTTVVCNLEAETSPKVKF